MSNEIYKLTVIELKQKIIQLGGKPHSKLNKNDLITYLSQLMSKVHGSNRINIIDNSYNICNDIREYEGYYCISHNGNDINDIKWKEEIEDKGWTVIKLPDIDTDYILDNFWDLIYKYDKISRDDINNWDKINGILPHLSHEDIVWKIRKQCKKVFTNIWNTNNLICSFDSPFFFSSTKKYKPLFNCNQSDFSYDFISIQGILNITDNNSLVLIENSNNIFEQYMKNNKDEYHQYINTKDHLLINQKWLKISVPKGTIILFDNRMFFSNRYPTNPDYSIGLNISMHPRDGATDEELKKRIKIFERKKATTSWCYGPHFEEVFSNKKCRSDIDISLYKDLI